jgi:hypothetical protein
VNGECLPIVTINIYSTLLIVCARQTTAVCRVVLTIIIICTLHTPLVVVHVSALYNLVQCASYDSVSALFMYCDLCCRGLVDFTIAGQIVSVVTAVIGVALFALPVGSIFESFQGVLAEANTNR